MKSLLLYFFLLSFAGSSVANAMQSQTMGGEISVSHVNGSQYRIHLKFWRFTAGIPAPQAFSVQIKNVSNSTIASSSIFVNQDSFIVISPNFAEERYYSSLFTFPSLTDQYELSFSFCCRGGAGIVNLFGSAGAYQLAVTTLFTPTVSGLANSSPTFSFAPVPIALANQVYVHSPIAYDPNGDSLSYRLATPKTCSLCTYFGLNLLIDISAFSPVFSPFFNQTLYAFNSNTGTFSWFPTQAGSYLYVYIIDEWRNGQLIGSVTRDFRFDVVNDTNNTSSPSITLNGNQHTGLALPQMNSYAGSSFNLNININDPDPGSKSLSFTGQMFQGNAQAIVTSSTTPTGLTANINWTPPMSMISNQPYILNVRYIEATPIHTFTRDIPIMVSVLPAVAGLENDFENQIKLTAYMNEAGKVYLNMNLEKDAKMSIYAYDVQGRSLGVLLEGHFEKGQHQSVHHQLASHSGMIILRAEDNLGWHKTIKLIRW